MFVLNVPPKETAECRVQPPHPPRSHSSCGAPAGALIVGRRGQIALRRSGGVLGRELSGAVLHPMTLDARIWRRLDNVGSCGRPEMMLQTFERIGCAAGDASPSSRIGLFFEFPGQ